MTSSTPSLSPVAARAAALVVTGLVAALSPGIVTPSYAGVGCGTLLATGDCEAPTAFIYSAKADRAGGINLEPGDTTTSDYAQFYVRTEAADPDGPGVTFSCRLERGTTVVSEWQDCSEPNPFDEDASRGNAEYEDLVPGAYTFSVKASDAATGLLGAAAPNEQEDPGTQLSWTVTEPVDDQRPPQTRLTVAAKRWHPFPYLAVEYAADEPLKSARCTLDGRGRACDESQASFFSLAAGDHVFRVAGVDFAGNTDPTPAVNRFTIPVPANRLGASGGWTRGTDYGAAYAATKKKGAWLRLARRGTRSAVLVADRGPGHGTVKVSYAGRVVRTIKLASSTRQPRRVIAIGSWAKAHPGRFTVTVASARKPVRVWGIGLSSWR